MNKEILHQLFEYKNGKLYWKIKPCNSIKIGDVAGYESKNRYIQVSVNKRLEYAHRVIFMMFYGHIPEKIDHIDRNKKNNKIENLRKATNSLNGHNRGINKNNISGVKGVHWHQGKWVAQITINRKKHYIGRFDSIQYAENALIAYRQKMLDWEKHGNL